MKLLMPVAELMKTAFACLLLAAAILPQVSEARIKRSQSAIVEFKREHPCPGHGRAQGAMQGLRDRPYQAAGLRGRRCAGKYAVADHGRRQGQGQMGTPGMR